MTDLRRYNVTQVKWLSPGINDKMMGEGGHFAKFRTMEGGGNRQRDTDLKGNPAGGKCARQGVPLGRGVSRLSGIHRKNLLKPQNRDGGNRAQLGKSGSVEQYVLIAKFFESA